MCCHLLETATGEEVSKHIIRASNTHWDNDKVVLETDAKDLSQKRLCERVTRVAAAEAKLDVLVVNMHNHMRSADSNNRLQERSQAVQDCKRFQKSNVLVTMPAWYVAKECCKWAVSRPKVASHRTRAGIGPHMDSNQRAAGQNGGTAPAREEVAPPAQLVGSWLGESELGQRRAMSTAQGSVDTAKVDLAKGSHLRDELEETCDLLQLQ